MIIENNDKEVNQIKAEKLKLKLGYDKTAINYLAGQTTFTEILSTNGNECGLVGKWHLGNSASPQCGLSRWTPIARGSGDYMKPEIIDNGQLKIKNKYVTEVITDQAIDFLNSSQPTKPFFLSVNYTAPHSPWDKESHPR